MSSILEVFYDDGAVDGRGVVVGCLLWSVGGAICAGRGWSGDDEWVSVSCRVVCALRAPGRIWGFLFIVLVSFDRFGFDRFLID
jgi:hypothetical protein